MKNRQYLFIAGCVLAIIVCYKYAIANTLTLYNEYKSMENTSQGINLQSSKNVETELLKVNAIIKGYSADTLMVRRNLLNEVNSKVLTNYCKIVSFPETKLYTEFGFLIMSNTMELEGSYFNLLKTLYSIEFSEGIGKINSCSFYVVEDIFKKTKKLRMKIIIQNISDHKI